MHICLIDPVSATREPGALLYYYLYYSIFLRFHFIISTSINYLS